MCATLIRKCWISTLIVLISVQLVTYPVMAQEPPPEIDLKEVQFDVINIVKGNKFSPDYAVKDHGHVSELLNLSKNGETPEIKDAALMAYIEVMHIHQWPGSLNEARELFFDRFNSCTNPFDCSRKIDLVAEILHSYPTWLYDTSGAIPENKQVLRNLRKMVTSGFGKKTRTVISLWQKILFYKLDSIELYAEFMTYLGFYSREGEGKAPVSNVPYQQKLKRRARDLWLNDYVSNLRDVSKEKMAATLAKELLEASGEAHEGEPDEKVIEIFAPLSKLFSDGIAQYHLGNKTMMLYAPRFEIQGLERFDNHISQELEYKNTNPTEAFYMYMRFFPFERKLDSAFDWINGAKKMLALIQAERDKRCAELDDTIKKYRKDHEEIAADLEKAKTTLAKFSKENPEDAKGIEERKVAVDYYNESYTGYKGLIDEYVSEREGLEHKMTGLQKSVKDMESITLLEKEEINAVLEGYKVSYREVILKNAIEVGRRFPEFRSILFQIRRLQRSKEHLMAVKETVKDMKKPTPEELTKLKEAIYPFQAAWLSMACFGFLTEYVNTPGNTNLVVNYPKVKDIIDDSEHDLGKACLGGLINGGEIARRIDGYNRRTRTVDADLYQYASNRYIWNEWKPVIAMGVTLIAMLPVVMASSGAGVGAGTRVAAWMTKRLAVKGATELTLRSQLIVGASYYASNVLAFEITRRTMMMTVKNFIKIGVDGKEYKVDFTDWYDPKKNWFENWGKDILMAGTAFFFLGKVGALSQKKAEQFFGYLIKHKYKVVQSAAFRDLMDFSFKGGGQALVVFPMSLISKQLEHFSKRKEGEPFFHHHTTKELMRESGQMFILLSGLIMIQRRTSIGTEIKEPEVTIPTPPPAPVNFAANGGGAKVPPPFPAQSHRGIEIYLPGQAPRNIKINP